jgi:hypothetical protein
MKKLLGIVVLSLFLITPSQADDIRDFQIEGMSIGDSLKKHFSNEKIKNFLEMKNAINYYPGSKKFFSLGTFTDEDNKIYDQIIYGLKKSDSKYIIYSLSGYSRMDYQKCLDESKSIFSEIKQLFDSENFEQQSYEKEHEMDPSEKSRMYSHDIDFSDGNVIRIICVNWSQEFEADEYTDSLSVIINSKVWADWIQNEAYK